MIEDLELHVESIRDRADRILARKKQKEEDDARLAEEALATESSQVDLDDTADSIMEKIRIPAGFTSAATHGSNGFIGPDPRAGERLPIVRHPGTTVVTVKDVVLPYEEVDDGFEEDDSDLHEMLSNAVLLLSDVTCLLMSIADPRLGGRLTTYLLGEAERLGLEANEFLKDTDSGERRVDIFDPDSPIYNTQDDSE